ADRQQDRGLGPDDAPGGLPFDHPDLAGASGLLLAAKRARAHTLRLRLANVPPADGIASRAPPAGANDPAGRAHGDTQMRVQLLSRAGCGLCDEAAAELHSRGLAFEVVDIDADAGLHSSYNEAVPVILVDGREVARAPIEAGAL